MALCMALYMAPALIHSSATTALQKRQSAQVKDGRAELQALHKQHEAFVVRMIYHFPWPKRERSVGGNV